MSVVFDELRPRARRAPSLLFGILLAASPVAAQGRADAARLVAALLGDTPMVRDLESLNDEIGGRATGSEANLKGVEWALGRFKDAGVTASKEPFAMPRLWLERSASASVQGDGIRFTARAAAMPFSVATGPGGRTAPLVDGGRGAVQDLARLGPSVRGAWVLIEQDELKDVPGLFKEYAVVAELEPRVMAAGALGMAYMGSRSNNLLYRHNAAGWVDTKYPAVILERDAALRAQRLIRAGKPLTMTAVVDLVDSGPYQSYNVIGEINGATRPDEIVLVGAHLDSWDLGTGALDNGANAVMLIDIARQMKRLGIRPARTVRFALWNGEEQGMYGSLGYTKTHASELTRHVMVTSIDLGTGRIKGFFTNGRAEILPVVARSLEAVAGLGPFTQLNVPIVGTDNFDFMLEGVANLVADQESANYGPNYHARSDEFHQADQLAMRQNAAIIGAMTLQLAETPDTWGRQSKAQVDQLVATTDLEQQMRQFGLWEAYRAGQRGKRQ